MRNYKYQYLYCPIEDAPLYEKYMRTHSIEFKKQGWEYNELLNIKQMRYRIPRNKRPHVWKLT